MNERKCAFCGETFIPTSHQQIYCKRPHYMNCPICGKRYLVKNNENLKRPPVACSYECRKVRRERTSLQKYGMKAPGNNPEARKKAKATMLEKYGVEYTLQSEELKHRVETTMKDKYGVDNAQKIKSVSEAARDTAEKKWIEKIHTLLPMKEIEKQENPKFRIDDDNMDVYLLTEKASKAFLQQYGFRLNPKFAKVHLSFGLVNDGILYQVIRFERIQGKIVLADFGIRDGYFNPNYYRKLIQFATYVNGINEFTSKIPRKLATQEVLDSLFLIKVSESEYEVYWKLDEGDKLFNIPPTLQKLTRNDNIQEMLKKYHYITTDYLDVFEYNAPTNGLEC